IETKKIEARQIGNKISVLIRHVQSPYPLDVTVHDPDGKELYRVRRAAGTLTNDDVGFPLGANAPAGDYAGKVTSPLPPRDAGFEGRVADKPGAVEPLDVEKRRVLTFGGQVVGKLLAGKAPIVVAHGDKHKEAAEKLATDLKAKGIDATAKPESEVLRKVP